MKKEFCAIGVSTIAIMALFFAATVEAQTKKIPSNGPAKVATAKSPKSGMTLEEYLARVQNESRSVKALEASTEAAEFRYLQADLELSPVLTLKGSYLDDKSLDTPGPGMTMSHVEAREYSMGLAKKFSTGTKASVTTGVASQSTTIDAGGPTANEITKNEGFMAFGLAQSLWKDFFGHATRLRWDRQEAQQLAEKQSYSLKTKQALIDAEAAFWDHVYLEQDLEIRKDNLERARKIESWVQRRVGNGIGDRADLLNAQGLVAARELEVINAVDELEASKKNIADILEIGESESVPTLTANLDKSRSMISYVEGGSSGKVIRLDSYLAVLEARAKEVGALEAADSVRPDLVLEGQYRTNGYDTTMRKAYSNSTDKDHPTTAVALTFTWLLDWETTGGVKTTAKQDALAAKLTKEKKLIESETAWEEIQRRHMELGKKIEASDKMAKIQTAKAAAERDKLSKGRSITSQVVTAEEDAAESVLVLNKLKVAQRKLESQGRIFVKVEGNL